MSTAVLANHGARMSHQGVQCGGQKSVVLD